jgi:serine/threonine protein kinase
MSPEQHAAAIAEADRSAAILRALEADAARGARPTLARALEIAPGLGDLPDALDAAIEMELRAIGGDALAAAQSMSTRHPEFADAILACALGLGLGLEDDGPILEWRVGALLFERWRIVELLGDGATASVARAQDELLSTASERVEVVVKVFDDAIGGEARLHALREMRALLAAPAGTAPRPLALHAPRGAAATLIVRDELSRPLATRDDLAAAVRTVRSLHVSGMAHGDLKPEHIRVRGDGTVFLIDFGTAGPADAASVARDLVRLADLADAVGMRRAPTLARAAIARGRPWLAAAALRGGSPTARRRTAIWSAVTAMAITAVASAGLAFGRTIAAPTGRVPVSGPADIVELLKASGRFQGAALDGEGRVRAFRLHTGEARPARDGPVVFDGIRIEPDGTIVMIREDSTETVLSPR